MSNNPNALVGTGSGLGGGAIIVYILGLLHVHIDTYAAGAIFAVVSGLVLLIGREGLAGIVHTVLHGTSKPAPPPPSTPVA